MFISKLLEGYENAELRTYDEITPSSPNTVAMSDLENSDVKGVLKCSKMIDGKLYLTFSGYDTHVGIISPTGMGKSSSFINPMLKINARRKVKPSMLIADPKGELYAARANDLRKNGYNVRLLNLRDYKHSDGFNILEHIYTKYHDVVDAHKRVQVVETNDGLKNEFDGKVFDSQTELDTELDLYVKAGHNDVDNLISEFVEFCIPITGKEPYWEMSARDILRGEIYAMLEDSDENLASYDKLITKDSFTFRTLFSMPMTGDAQKKFFDHRTNGSRSRMCVMPAIVDNANTTAMCISSTHASQMGKFRDSAIQHIMSFSSFKFDEFVEKPTALFIIFKDEVDAHYEVISVFIKQLYAYLVDAASKKKFHRLERPFYFVLDEFANMPKWDNFRRNISISASRNIFFILALQSYSQLDSIYGPSDAKTIVQNLNYKVFMGSNDAATLENFSHDCGLYTRISPISATSGDGPELKSIQFETIPLLPISKLSVFKPGECVITEVNSKCTLWSCMQRYFLCPELNDYEYCDEKEYQCDVNAYEERFIFDYANARKGDLSAGAQRKIQSLRAKINAYTVRKQVFTVPMIQHDCDVSYFVAKSCVNYMLNCSEISYLGGLLYKRASYEPNQIGITDFIEKPVGKSNKVDNESDSISALIKRLEARHKFEEERELKLKEKEKQRKDYLAKLLKNTNADIDDSDD